MKSANVLEIVPRGRMLFLEQIIIPPTREHTVTAVVDLMRLERDGFPISRPAITGCTRVLLELRYQNATTVYKHDLEGVVLEQSAIYYREETNRLLESCDAAEYLRRVCDFADSRISTH